MIGGPIGWVVVNVVPYRLVSPFVADDVFIVITLPETFVKWRPFAILDAVPVFGGGDGFDPLDYIK